MGEHFKRISNILKYIKKNYKPNNFFDFADIDDPESFTVIVDGNKLSLLPKEFNKFKLWENFHLHFNPITTTVMYYAFDTNFRTSEEDETYGFIEWEEAEASLYEFLVRDMKNITTSGSTYTAMISDKKESGPTTESTHKPTVYSQYSSNDFASSYRLRENVIGPLKENLREFKTIKCINHVNVSIEKLIKDEKFDVIDDILKFVEFDKLNIPIMLAFLKSTSLVEKSLKDRKGFAEKVERYVTKIRPNSTNQLMKLH